MHLFIYSFDFNLCDPFMLNVFQKFQKENTTTLRLCTHIHPLSFLSSPFLSFYFPSLPSSLPFSSPPPPTPYPFFSYFLFFSLYVSLILFPCYLKIFGNIFKLNNNNLKLGDVLPSLLI